MDASNVVAHELESYGVRTFSAKEILNGALCILYCSASPKSSLSGQTSTAEWIVFQILQTTTRIRLSLNKKGELLRAIAKDNTADFKITNGL